MIEVPWEVWTKKNGRKRAVICWAVCEDSALRKWAARRPLGVVDGAQVFVCPNGHPSIHIRAYLGRAVVSFSPLE